MKLRSRKSEAASRRIVPLRLAALAVLGALMLCGCKARRAYPDLMVGWHSPQYTTVMGRIQLVKQTDPAAKPVWIIRYGNPGSDAYNGRLNLYPEGAMVGFTGGEMVEIKGAVKPQYTLPGFPGMWFEVDEIRMWSNHAAQ